MEDPAERREPAVTCGKGYAAAKESPDERAGRTEITTDYAEGGDNASLFIGDTSHFPHRILSRCALLTDKFIYTILYEAYISPGF